MHESGLGKLNARVTQCILCPRLAEYVKMVGEQKVKRFSQENYWARPLPSWGDPKARLLIVGLAPAAHGGNRTGRMFTGDSSGDWLMRAMHETGFASKPTSQSKDDGLVLTDAYITAALRCAPPANKPTPVELANCSQYLLAELEMLKEVRVILALGRIGFEAYCRAARVEKAAFGHGRQYELERGMVLLASYHPSRQNTNTGKLSWTMWIDIFRKVRLMLKN